MCEGGNVVDVSVLVTRFLSVGQIEGEIEMQQVLFEFCRLIYGPASALAGLLERQTEEVLNESALFNRVRSLEGD